MQFTNKTINDRYSNSIAINQQESSMNVSKTHHFAPLAAAIALSIGLAAPTADAGNSASVFGATALSEITRASNETSVSPAMLGEEDGGLSCEETVSGVLGEAGDSQLESGVFVDTLEFDTVNPSQFYKITVNSSEFPAQSVVLGVDNAGEGVAKQGAFVFAPGEQVQYSGILANPGRNTIFIHSSDGQPTSTGSYTVSLSCQDASTSGGIVGGTGTNQDPFIGDINAPIASELLESDESFQDEQGGVHFLKFFKPNTSGGTVQVSASSDSFTPYIFVLDRSTGNIVDRGPGPLSVEYSDSIVFAVTNSEPNATGPFTITMSQDGGVSSGGAGTFESPIQFAAGQPLNAELTSAGDSLSDGNGGTYYAKVFRSDSINGSVAINVQATNFTPAIYLFDPASGNLEPVPAGSSVNYNSSLMIVVSSQELQATGAFTFSAAASQGGSF